MRFSTMPVLITSVAVILVLFSGCVEIYDSQSYRFGVFPPGNQYDGYRSAMELKITEPRVIVSWNDFEPEKNNFDFQLFDAHITFFSNVNMKPIVTIKSDSSWGTRGGFHHQTASPPKDMQDYIDFLTVFVNRYKDKIDYWQIENEIYDHGLYWEGTREEYVDLLKNAYNTIKEIDPDSKVVLNGLANFMFLEIEKGNEEAIDFLDYLMSHGEYFDVIDFHYYYEPNQIYNTVNILKNSMQKHGYTKPLIITEAGDIDLRLFGQHITGDPVPVIEELLTIEEVRNELIKVIDNGTISNNDVINFSIFLTENIHSRPLIEKYQAENLVKRISLSFSLGIESFNWLGMIELREPDTPDWFFTIMPLMDNTGVHKPAYYTYKLLIDQLDGINNVKKINDYVYNFSFNDTKPHIYIAWIDNDETVIDLSSEIHGYAKVTQIITEREKTDKDAVIKQVDPKSIHISNTPVLITQLDPP